LHLFRLGKGRGKAVILDFQLVVNRRILPIDGLFERKRELFYLIFQKSGGKWWKYEIFFVILSRKV